MRNIQTPLRRAVFWRRHRYALFFFLYSVFYHTVVVSRLNPFQMDELAYVESFCADYSFGFATKLLPGAIFRFLLGEYASKTTAISYSLVLLLLFFAGLAVLLEKFMERVKEEYRGAALFLLLFYLSGAYTFSIFTEMLGLMDTYWLLFSLLFFCFLKNKWLRFLIPLLFVASLLIHFSAVVFYIPLFSIVLLYCAAQEPTKKQRCIYGGIFALSVLTALVVFFFFILNESKMICSMETFHQKLSQRGTDYYFYHNYSFFRIWGDRSFIPDAVREMEPSLKKFFSLFYYQVKLNIDLFHSNWKNGSIATLGGLVMLCPAVFMILKFHWQRFRREKNGLRRFCSFLMMAQFPFILALSFLFAICVDVTRYFSHGFLVLFTCMLTVLYFEDAQQTRFFERFRSLAQTLPMKLYFLAYASLTLMPAN